MPQTAAAQKSTALPIHERCSDSTPSSAGGVHSFPKSEHVQQWICVPPCLAINPALNKQRDFHVLAETKRGRLVWFSVNQREVPGVALVEVIARRMDAFEDPPGFDILVGDLYAHCDITVTKLDELITNEACWGLDLWSRRDIVAAVCESDFSEISASQLRDGIIQRNTKWLRDHLERFVHQLDIEVTETTGSLRPSFYNYFLAGCETHRRNRIQAATLFPIFIANILAPKLSHIRQTIDDGKPLIDAVARRYMVSRPVVRAIRGTSVLAAGELADGFEILLLVLRDVPAGWLPRAPSDWVRFAETVRHIERLSQQPITTTANRLILRDCARRGYRPTDLDSDEWWRVGHEIDEFIRAVREAARYKLREMPAAAYSDKGASHQIDRMLLSLGMKRVGHIARRWSHAHRRAQAAQKAEDIYSEIYWPLISATPLPVDQLIAHQLATAEALVEEGRAMKNCLSSYVHACMTGESQIWSLRTPNGARVATLETAVTRGDDELPIIRISQHAASHNTKPSPMAEKAARHLQQQLNGMRESLQRYLHWKETAGKKPISERVIAVSVGLIITALDEVLPKQWSLESMIDPKTEVKSHA